MKVNLIQQNIVWGDPQANFKALEPLIDKSPSADLYVLPEMFSTGFATPKGATVEKEPSAGLNWMKAKSKALNAAFAGSIAYQLPIGPDSDDCSEASCASKVMDRCVNRFFFVTPDGQAVVYDKRHMFGYGGENERFNAGNRRVVVEYKGVRFLLAVCYDLRFPVWMRNLSDYDAIILVANWPQVRRLAWDTLTRARAIENQCYMLAVNRVGQDPSCLYSGGTALINPYGEAICVAEDDCQTVISGEIDMEHLMSFRKKFPVLEGADSFTINL